MVEHRIETGIDIEASAERVWAILTDFARMPEWNPFIRSISGDLRPGGRLLVEIAPPGRTAMRFKPAVLALRAPRELRWRGSFIVPGLFDGEHYFLIEPVAQERARLTHGERFSGLLVGMMRGALAATERGFDMMNVALKERAEGRN